MVLVTHSGPVKVLSMYTNENYRDLSTRNHPIQNEQSGVVTRTEEGHVMGVGVVEVGGGGGGGGVAA